MRNYCHRRNRFRKGGPNERVRKRLEIVLRTCQQRYPNQPAPQGVFTALCQAARQRIP
jgi:hypothetical protein